MTIVARQHSGHVRKLLVYTAPDPGTTRTNDAHAGTYVDPTWRLAPLCTDGTQPTAPRPSG